MAERADLATLVGSMRAWGSSPAVVEHRGARRFVTSYGELAELALRFSRELAKRGIGPGERVVLFGANSAEWVAAFFGCVLRGVLVVPLDAAGAAGFAERVVRQTEPRLVVGDRELVGGGGLGAPVLFLDALAGLPVFEGASSLPPLGPETPLQILFTSGTTGTPKGVVHTHGNLLASLGPIEREIGKYRKYERWVHPLRFLHTLPLSHVFGQFMGLWVPPLLGATVVYESRVSRVAELIPGERVHVLAAVPRTLGLLRGHLLGRSPGLAAAVEGAAGLPLARRWWRFRRVHWRLGLRFWAAVCGGATLPASLESFWTGLGFALVQGYGLTETAALVTLNHPFRTARGSLGQALPGRELRLSASGELEVKGAMVAEGSWEGGRIVPRESPWLATGDLAEIEGGRVRFLGRTGQRLVTAAGLNVYLQDVEGVLEAQPEIAEAVVFGSLGAEGGEEPAAVVVARGDAAAGIARANGGLAAHQRVGRWWVWPGLALPRTSTGKVRRAVVEGWARSLEPTPRHPSEHGPLAGNPGRPSVAETDEGAVGLLLEVGARRGPLEDGARLDEDWGLDSMGRVALASALEERLGVEVGDGMASRIRTLGDLRAVVQGTSGSAGPAQDGVKDTLAESQRGGARAQAGSVSSRVNPAAEAGMPEKGVGRGGSREREIAGRAVRYRYPTWPWWAPARLARFCFTELVARPLTAMLAAPTVRRSRETAQSPPEKGTRPMLLIANHRTALDLPLILFALPLGLRRRLAVAMSGEILAGWANSWNRRPLPAAIAEHRRWWGPPVGFLLKALFNVFPLPRTSGFRASFAHAGRALDRGFHVLIFPEGRRVSAGMPLSFRPGLGILARECFVPVLPIALAIPAGAERRWFRSRPVVSIGAPVRVNPGEPAEIVTERLRALVEGLQGTIGS